MNKKEVFKKELELIRNADIRLDLINLLDKLPDYFYRVPASTSGKYHPLFAQGEGGLVRHTKLVVRIGYDLLNLEMYDEVFNGREKDLIIMALLLHDGIKKGVIEEEHILLEHPLLGAKFVKENSDLNELEKELVGKMIASHMGEWNKDKNGNEIMLKPKTKYEKFVHICDYLASRQYLDVKFDENSDIILIRSRCSNEKV